MSVSFTPYQVDQARSLSITRSGTWPGYAQLTAGTESCGQSVERLQADLTPAPLGCRRGVVVGRQLFFFSHAYRLTAEPIYRNCAILSFEDLTNNFWDEKNGGWYFSLTVDNGPSDTTKDLYGHAFILFGWLMILYFPTTKLCNGLAEPTSSSWIALPWREAGSRRQRREIGPFSGRNCQTQIPHMHLLEADLLLYKTTKDDLFLRCATRIMSIYTEMLRTSDRSQFSTSR